MTKFLTPISLLTCLALLLTSIVSFADATSLEAKLRTVNGGRFADAPIKIMGELPLKGFYEVIIGGQYVVVDETGEYLILGGILDLNTMVNITESRKDQMKVEMTATAIKKLPEDIFVNYSPKGEVKGTMYVYSDPNCGYCKKVHKELDQYLAAGIEVKYIPYPIFGEKSVEQTKQMMCAGNPEKAMTELMNGTDNGKYAKSTYPKQCAELVSVGSASGRGLGISGTPYIYLSTGRVIGGYQSAEVIINELLKVSKG